MKLIETLTVLNKNEWLSLRKFLHMNHREGSDVLDLFLILNKSRGKLDEDQLVDKIKKKHFKKLTQKAYLNIFSKIYQEVEDWLVYFDIRNNRNEHKIQLIKSLNDRSLYKLATNVAEKLEKQIVEDKSVSLENDNDLRRLLHMQYYSNNPIKSVRPTMLIDLVNTSLSYFQNKLLAYDCELENWGRIKKLDIKKQSEIIQSISKAYKTNVLGDDFIRVKKMLNKVSKEDFSYFHDRVFRDAYTLNTETNVLIYSYCIRVGNMSFSNIETDELKKQIYGFIDRGMETGVLTSKSKIQPISFTNLIVLVATVISNEVAETFLDKWIDKVDVKDLETFRRYALANLFYTGGQYHEIIDLLANNPISFELEGYRSIALLIIAYAEDLDNYYEVLKNTIENHKRQIKRNKSKISERIYSATLNFLEIVNIIADYKYTKVKVDISKYDSIFYRQWVEKKIKQGY